jgi:methyl-accepting chemotaxis protein
MDSLFNSTFDILQKSNDKLLPNDSFNYNYKTLQKKFDKINTANTYISDGVKEQADAIEGIVEEIADLKDISNNLNKTLKKINYSNKS